MMGNASGQDAMGIHLPITDDEAITASEAIKSGSDLPDLVHPIASIKESDGTPFTRQEAENLGTIASSHGVELQTNPDRTAIEFHNYYGDPQEWRTNVNKVVNDAGLNNKDYAINHGFVKSDYIERDDHLRHIQHAADSPEQPGRLGAAGAAYARAHEESFRNITKRSGDDGVDQPLDNEPPPQPAVPPTEPPANAGGSSAFGSPRTKPIVATEARPGEGLNDPLFNLPQDEQVKLRNDVMMHSQGSAPPGKFQFYHDLGIDHDVIPSDGSFRGEITPNYLHVIHGGIDGRCAVCGKHRRLDESATCRDYHEAGPELDGRRARRSFQKGRRSAAY